MLVFFTNLGLMEFQVRYLALFPLFLVIGGFGWFWMGKSSQEYPVNAGVQGSILGPTLLLYINDLPDDVICNIALCADDTNLISTLNVIRHLICGNNLNLI